MIILTRLIDNLIISNELHANNFVPDTEEKLFVVFSQK